jgi:serine/threonine protein phosphatase PrpC
VEEWFPNLKVKFFINFLDNTGPYRVWVKGERYPGIAMSRSIGDLIGTSVGVICIPDIFEIKIEPSFKFITIASDGIWEFLQNDQVKDLTLKFYEKRENESACKLLIKEATKLWKKEEIVIDDITAIIIYLYHSG